MKLNSQEALQRIIEHREIFHDEMLDLMRQIMSGEMSPVMIAALTVALRVKKETVGEIMGLKHRQHPTFGVQFHPESILTEHGYAMLKNFLEVVH